MSLESELFAAAGYGDLNEINQLIDKGVNVNARHPVLGGNALHMAASCLNNGEDKEAVLKALLMKGADPNLKDFHGNTAIMLATQLDVHGETVKTFFKEEYPYKVNLAIKNNKNQTLEEMANQFDAKGVLNLIEQAKSGLLPSEHKPEGFVMIAKEKCGNMLNNFRKAMKGDDLGPSTEDKVTVNHA